MKLLVIIILVLFVILVFGLFWKYQQSSNSNNGVSFEKENLPVVRGFDLEKYLGTWYEIARLPNVFERGCTNPVAMYTLDNNGIINVKNQCQVGDKIVEVNGVLKPDYPSLPLNSQIGRFHVYFENNPIPGEYNIIFLDPYYQYAMVGTTDRKNLWFLSRSQNIDAENMQLMLMKAKILGYNTNNLITSKKIEN